MTLLVVPSCSCHYSIETVTNKLSTSVVPGEKSITMAAELKYGERKVKFKEHQWNVKWIGKFFGLYPESILLSSEEGIETPDESGQFKLEEYSGLLYTVQGDPVPRLHGQDEQGPSFMYTAPNHCLPYQHLYGSTPKRAKSPRFTLKSTTSGSKPLVTRSVSNMHAHNVYMYRCIL